MNDFVFAFDPRERKPQRLIDANNISLNGLICPDGFEEFLKLVLDRQKTAEPKTIRNEVANADSSSFYESDDPCDGCGCFGSAGCQNECPYG